LGFPQIKINGDLFSVSTTVCGGGAVSQWVIDRLIVRDGNHVLTGSAEAGEDDRHLDQCCRQRYRL
jgi:hypothetical protein